MYDSWDERSGPSIVDARNEFKNFKLDGITVPESIVERCIHREHAKYDGFGSWRGWATFSRRSIVQECIDEFNNLNTLASKLHGNIIILNWINDRLYRPGDGLRYSNVRDSFNMNCR